MNSTILAQGGGWLCQRGNISGMENFYRSQHVIKLFDISRETVRAWSGEFAQYLSPQATPGKGKTRQFTEDDLRVFALVHEQKQAGLLFEDVHAALASGLRGEIPKPKQAQGTGAVAIETASHKRQLATLQTRIDELETALETAQNERQQLTGQVELLKEQLRDSQNEVKELSRQIGKLQRD